MRKTAFSIFLVVLSGSVGFLLNYISENFKKEGKYIDTEVFYSNLSKITSHDIKIKFDTTTIENLYRVDVQVYNFNDVDFDNIPIYIELFGNQDGVTKVLSEEAWGVDGNKEIIDKIEELNTSNKPCGFRRGYLVKNARKGDVNHPILRVTYFIDAKNISDYDVFVDKKGLLERKYTFDNYSKSDQYPIAFFLTGWGFVVYLLIGVLGAILLFSILSRLMPDSSWIERQKVIMPKLLEYIQQEKEDIEVKKVINRYETLYKKYKWENASFLSRLMNGYKKPREDEE